MKRLQLYKELRRHRKIADKRALDSTMNKNAKIMVYIGISAMLLYLIFFAIMFSLAINNDNSTSALEFIFTIAPFILAIDFGVRFISQQTPAQLVKPYLLLPVSRYICTEAFITSSLFTWGNAIWYALLLPYCLMSVLFSYGIWATILFLCTFYVLFLINSQWYLICRTLIGTNMLWVLLPVAVYATIAAMAATAIMAAVFIFTPSWEELSLDDIEDVKVECGTANGLNFVPTYTLRGGRYTRSIGYRSNPHFKWESKDGKWQPVPYRGCLEIRGKGTLRCPIITGAEVKVGSGVTLMTSGICEPDGKWRKTPLPPPDTQMNDTHYVGYAAYKIEPGGKLIFTDTDSYPQGLIEHLK